MADVSDPAIKATYEEMRKNASPITWMCLGYEGNKIVLSGQGEGELSDLTSQFQDDQVQYGYAKVITGDSESKRTKFVFISWCGEKVGALKRAKLSVHKASVKTVVKDFAVEVHGETPDEVTQDIIVTKVRKAGGADYSGNLFQ